MMPVPTVSGTLAVDTPARSCFHGSEYCIEGNVEHGACQSALATVYVPGGHGAAAILDAQIIDCGDGPALSFSANTYDGTEISASQLRAVVADVAHHLSRLLAIADQYEAVLASGKVAGR